MPVEFTRQSDDGRMTLVVEARAAPLTVLWAHMVPLDLAPAVRALCNREGIADQNCSSWIGSWNRGESAPCNIADLPVWAEIHEIDAVVWTALSPRFEGKSTSPSVDEVIDYLRGLREPLRRRAREYIQRAPHRSIQTTDARLRPRWDGPSTRASQRRYRALARITRVTSSCCSRTITRWFVDSRPRRYFEFEYWENYRTRVLQWSNPHLSAP